MKREKERETRGKFEDMLRNDQTWGLSALMNKHDVPKEFSTRLDLTLETFSSAGQRSRQDFHGAEVYIELASLTFTHACPVLS